MTQHPIGGLTSCLSAFFKVELRLSVVHGNIVPNQTDVCAYERLHNSQASSISICKIFLAQIVNVEWKCGKVKRQK